MRVIHYNDNNCSTIKSKRWDSKEITTTKNKNKVTCKLCLKRISK